MQSTPLNPSSLITVGMKVDGLGDGTASVQLGNAEQNVALYIFNNYRALKRDTHTHKWTALLD